MLTYILAFSKLFRNFICIIVTNTSKAQRKRHNVNVGYSKRPSAKQKPIQLQRMMKTLLSNIIKQYVIYVCCYRLCIPIRYRCKEVNTFILPKVIFTAAILTKATCKNMKEVRI